MWIASTRVPLLEKVKLGENHFSFGEEDVTTKYFYNQQYPRHPPW